MNCNKSQNNMYSFLIIVLVRDLTRLFSQYAQVLQVVTRKGIRGQAFVVFPDVKSAIHAKESAQDQELYDRQIVRIFAVFLFSV